MSFFYEFPTKTQRFPAVFPRKIYGKPRSSRRNNDGGMPQVAATKPQTTCAQYGPVAAVLVLCGCEGFGDVGIGACLVESVDVCGEVGQ